MRFNKKIELVLFVAIVLVASFLRLWQLGHVPPSPDWDEAALGYNAYSIKETGKDEYGEPFPIILRSFDDYKPALYVYFVIPFISLFGLDIFAVRLVSALFGIATVIVVYFLIHELTRMQTRINPTESSRSPSATIRTRLTERFGGAGAEQRGNIDQHQSASSSATISGARKKLGRNDKCWCGATKPDGTPKKYKHCHWPN